MLFLTLGLVLGAGFMPTRAQANELDDVRNEISDKTNELKQLADEIEDEKEAISKLEKDMNGLLSNLAEKQEELSRLQGRAADFATFMYKDYEDFDLFLLFNEASSLEDLLNRMEMRDKMLAASTDVLKDMRAKRDEIQATYDKTSKEKDQQQALLADMNKKQDKLDKAIAELKEREEQLDREQKEALARAAAIAQQAASGRHRASTFETDVSDNGFAKEDGWKVGIASAYGGKSDPSTPNPGVTATGTRCDDWSIGVAVPMAWGPEKYYGLYVEISYGGQSIVAPVVDCGGMGGGSRSLDLQPGVFKAFGASTCDQWGLREVHYRFL